jgi:hypothetical protein
MPNPMLILSIWNSQKENEEGEARILHSAVHAWYEGHIHAHVEVGEKVEILPPRDDFPPPFPAHDDDDLWEIVTATKGRAFTSLDAALAFAAALAWEAGYRRGKECPGCQAFGNRDAEYSASVRQGRVRITIGAGPLGSRFEPEELKG